MSRSLEGTLARISAEEMVAALGMTGTPALLQATARAALSFASVPLGRMLARFDRRIALQGVAAAAAVALQELGAKWTCEGTPPAAGPLLVVANHPGAYDALLLLAAIDRRDVVIVAAHRTFLHALPGLSTHLVFVGEGPDPLSRITGIRRALRHLAGGGTVLHFGAGRIEPDPVFVPRGEPLLQGAWASGTGALVRGAAIADGLVVAAIAEGVHSARAKRLLVTRLAESRGVTTLAPLLQVALRRYRDVNARVRFTAPVVARSMVEGRRDLEITERVRTMALGLLGPRHG